YLVFDRSVCGVQGSYFLKHEMSRKGKFSYKPFFVFTKTTPNIIIFSDLCCRISYTGKLDFEPPLHPQKEFSRISRGLQAVPARIKSACKQFLGESHFINNPNPFYYLTPSPPSLSVSLHTPPPPSWTQLGPH